MSEVPRNGWLWWVIYIGLGLTFFGCITAKALEIRGR